MLIGIGEPSRSFRFNVISVSSFAGVFLLHWRFFLCVALGVEFGVCGEAVREDGRLGAGEAGGGRLGGVGTSWSSRG
jgi:hypothetical protein